MTPRPIGRIILVMQTIHNTHAQTAIAVDQLTKRYGRLTAVDELSYVPER
jgi:hypothetical protein